MLISGLDQSMQRRVGNPCMNGAPETKWSDPEAELNPWRIQCSMFSVLHQNYYWRRIEARTSDNADEIQSTIGSPRDGSNRCTGDQSGS